MKTLTQTFKTLALCAGMALCGFGAQAQGVYPDKSIRMVVPYNAGGGTDVLARAIAVGAGKILKQTIVVDNKPGASGMIGSDFVAKAAPDGYTILMTAADTHSINPHVYPKIAYDALKDFAPIAQVGLLPYALVVNPKVPAKNIHEFIALAKSQPGKLTYASWGVGSSSQVAMEMLKVLSGLDILHVPFTGAAPAMTAVLGGQVDAMFVPLSLAVPNAEAGKVVVMGLGAPARFVGAPNMPTLAEQGIKVFTSPWISILGPAKMPKAAVDAIYSAVNEAVKDPQIIDLMIKGGLQLEVLNPEQFGKVLVSEFEHWGATVKAAGIKADQ
ncbi:MAG: tripartite tricarboxylate transporter substrate binding protein [Alcaligenaceae bacterium]